MKTSRDLVRVLIELATRVQLGHDDFRGGTLELVVFLHVNGNAAAVVDNGDRIVGVDHDFNVVAVTRKRLIDCVVEDFENHVMEPGPVGSISDVHSGALAHRFQALQDLDAVGIVVAGVVKRPWIDLAHSILSCFS